VGDDVAYLGGTRSLGYGAFGPSLGMTRLSLFFLVCVVIAGAGGGWFGVFGGHEVPRLWAFGPSLGMTRLSLFFLVCVVIAGAGG